MQRINGILAKVIDEVTKLMFTADQEGLTRDMWDSKTDKRVIQSISDADKGFNERSVERGILNDPLAGNPKGLII